MLSGTFRDFQLWKLKYDKLLSSFAFNCNLRHYSKEQHDTLWVGNYGPYVSFQHFVIDKLPNILAAYEMLRDDPKAKLLLHAEKRGREQLTALGLDMSKFVVVSSAKSFCAKNLLMDTALPG